VPSAAVDTGARSLGSTLFVVIDLHSHLLPGLDDGARDLEEALAIARAMADDGVRIVAATPHVRHDYPTSAEAMEAALATGQEAVAAAGIELEVRGGGELALDALPELSADERVRFGLGGNPRLLLLEFPYYGWPMGLTQTVFELASQGVVAVVAHPERNAEVQEKPERLADIVRVGGVVQLTAASVDGRLGRAPAACARRLLELELAHLIASDAHAPSVRQAGLSSAAAAAGGEELGRWLTHDVPAALLAGVALPPRPPLPRRRLRSRLGW
jgi:protein-tyrosine phosphatase